MLSFFSMSCLLKIGLWSRILLYTYSLRSFSRGGGAPPPRLNIDPQFWMSRWDIQIYIARQSHSIIKLHLAWIPKCTIANLTLIKAGQSDKVYSAWVLQLPQNKENPLFSTWSVNNIVVICIIYTYLITNLEKYGGFSLYAMFLDIYMYCVK